MTAPCQFPGCGRSEQSIVHSCFVDSHPPTPGCHPYNSTPTEPTSALGYLLGHLPNGEMLV